MPDPIRLDIPSPPPHELSPNASRFQHWGTRNRIKHEWARLWRHAALDAMGAAGRAVHLTGPVRLRVTYLKGKGARQRDVDGIIATCKHGIDALQEAGLIRNDSQVVAIEVEQRRSPDGIGKTVVTVEEVPQP